MRTRNILVQFMAVPGPNVLNSKHRYPYRLQVVTRCSHAHPLQKVPVGPQRYPPPNQQHAKQYHLNIPHFHRRYTERASDLGSSLHLHLHHVPVLHGLQVIPQPKATPMMRPHPNHITQPKLKPFTHLQNTPTFQTLTTIPHWIHQMTPFPSSPTAGAGKTAHTSGSAR